jgi:hypothetical protein
MIKYYVLCVHNCGAVGRAVVRLTALQARKSRVRLFAGGLLGYFIDLILPAALCVLGSTQLLKQMRIADISLGVKEAGAMLTTL